MPKLIKYQVTFLLMEFFNDYLLHTWSSDYGRFLQSIGASKISIISKGKTDLAYHIDNQETGFYVQIKFSSTPKVIGAVKQKIDADPQMMRALITAKPYLI